MRNEEDEEDEEDEEEGVRCCCLSRLSSVSAGAPY